MLSSSLTINQNSPPMEWNPQTFRIGDLPLESGEVIEDCQISACILGSSNPTCTVLTTASIAGTHRRLDFLIGPGLALNTDHYRVIATDALGNGLSSSPSNSASQPGTGFPNFTIRDMVDSQAALLDHLGIDRIDLVIGASMGGMQALQWAVSHPKRIESVVAITPMARSTAWSRSVNAVSRQLLMSDSGWTEGTVKADTWYGWAALMSVIAGRTPVSIAAEFPTDDADALLQREQANVIERDLDPRDWIWQTRAYDSHDVGHTSGHNGDTAKALGTIDVPVLVLAAPGDLYNPEAAARWVAEQISTAEYLEIPSIHGHQAGASRSASDVDFMDRQIARFLEQLRR